MSIPGRCTASASYLHTEVSARHSRARYDAIIICTIASCSKCAQKVRLVDKMNADFASRNRRHFTNIQMAALSNVIRTSSNVSCEMICPGEGSLARAALEESLLFQIGYSSSQLILGWCRICLHCKCVERQWHNGFGERGGGESGERWIVGRTRAKSCAARPARQRTAAEAGPVPHITKSPARLPLSIVLNRWPNTETACLLGWPFLILISADKSLFFGS